MLDPDLAAYFSEPRCSAIVDGKLCERRSFAAAPCCDGERPPGLAQQVCWRHFLAVTGKVWQVARR